MKTKSNVWTVIARELGEIRDWLRPFSAKVAGLILVALVIAGVGMTLAIPIAAHPGGLAGFIAGTLAGWCNAGAACQFEQIYPPFVAAMVVFATTITMFFIILHMYAHRYDVGLDEVDTVNGFILDQLSKLNAKLDQDLIYDQEALDLRIKENGKR